MREHATQRGFSLIELILVIVILGIAGTAVLGQFAYIGPGLLNSEAMQTAAQLAQERAEEILADRRLNNYSAATLDALDGTTDTLTSPYDIYTRSISVTAIVAPTARCPAGDCREITISVSKGGASLADIDFMVANY